MKKIITSCVLTLVIVLFSPQITHAQGTTYLSNLAQTSTGSLAAGSNSWVASAIITGNNPSGYALNSVQLLMTDASGNPTNFAFMIYSAVFGAGVNPGSNLGTLDGSLNPTPGGVFTYTPASNLTLSPNADYFIVMTAGTAVANGAYDWSLTIPNSYNPSDGWGAGGIWQSSDGSIWHFSSGAPQFAINAIPIPEPGVLGLFGLGGLFFLRHRRKSKAV